MIELIDGFITLRPFIFENAKEHLANEDEAQVKWLSGEKGTLEGVQNWIKGSSEDQMKPIKIQIIIGTTRQTDFLKKLLHRFIKRLLY
jgi:hypothetical protein